MKSTAVFRSTSVLSLCLALAAGALASSAEAAEGAKSLYLLGRRGPVAGMIPKAGFYVTDDVYHYSGGREGLTPFGDLVAGDVSANALINVAQLTWVTDEFLEKGRFALGVVLPYGRVEVDASATATLPSGIGVGLPVSSGETGFGDAALAASLGWRNREGDDAFAWNVYSALFIPSGDYELGRLTNIGANHWGLDVGSAFTWGNFGNGREFSSVIGITFNGENQDTDYQSGTELHLEAAFTQHLPHGFSVGVGGYWYEQLTGDSGAGAILGDFKGRAVSIGPEAGYSFKVADRSVSLSLRWYHEFEVKNRLEGDGVFLTLSLPLQSDAAAAK
jgi:hypothetical protein